MKPGTSSSTVAEACVRAGRLRSLSHAGICLLLGFFIAGTSFVVAATAAVNEETAGSPVSDGNWLEPLGLNIVDMVGEVPDAYLSGTVVSYTPGYGIVRYESGRRIGNTVTVTAKAFPRHVIDRGWHGSMFGCLGQGARIDQLGSAAPASTLRVYHQGRDVTNEVFMMSLVPSGKRQPILNPRESEGQNRYRYEETDYRPTVFTTDRQVAIPANMGCELIISSQDYRELTLVFTVQMERQVKVALSGSESFTFHSYLGPGYTGLLDSLVQQLMSAGYGHRAERYRLSLPAQADYFLLNFPPSTVDPYTIFAENPLGNIDRPVGGTYRVGIPYGLSVDHVNSMGLPLRGHWQDIDQADGTWLRYSNQGVQLLAPEYFVPAGVPYDTCMIAGGCSREILDRIYNTAMSMRIIYLSVERVSSGIERIPVQMVGSSYRGLVAPLREVAARPENPSAKWMRILLPSIGVPAELPPLDDCSGCSEQGGCGWFTADGRMVDYIPQP